MSPRLKKLIGMIALLPALFLYLFAAAALGELLPNNQALKVGFYMIAGIAWAFPVKYLMQWMNVEPPAANASDKTDPNRD